MKSTAIAALANPNGLKPKKHYEELLEAYAKEATVRQMYFYQQGFSPQKYENIQYDLKKLYGISEKDIALAKIPEAIAKIAEAKSEEQNANGQLPTADSKTQHEKDIENLNLNSKPDPILEQMPDDARQGLKLRDEYPFLNDPSVPDEFKILISDKILAFNMYAGMHAEALKAATESEAADKLYEYAKAAIGNYQINQDIKAELDFYRDTKGKVLGKVPQLHNLKIKQEIGEMSEADLVKHRNNALKSVSKYDNAGNKPKADEWRFRLTQAEKRLVEKFNHKFEAKG